MEQTTMKAPMRGRSLGTKLTEVEYARVESAALKAGVGLSEWCRRSVLAAAEDRDRQPGDHVLLAEVLALRSIVLNLMFRQASGTPLNAEEMQQLIERADREKQKRASTALGAGADRRD